MTLGTLWRPQETPEAPRVPRPLQPQGIALGVAPKG